MSFSTLAGTEWTWITRCSEGEIVAALGGDAPASPSQFAVRYIGGHVHLRADARFMVAAICRQASNASARQLRRFRQGNQSTSNSCCVDYKDVAMTEKCSHARASASCRVRFDVLKPIGSRMLAMSLSAQMRGSARRERRRCSVRAVLPRVAGAHGIA